MLKPEFPRSRLLPITTSATAETIALYRWLCDMGVRRSWALGTSEMLKGDAATDSPGAYESIKSFRDVSGGKGPAIVGFEYHDPSWTDGGGATWNNHLIARIKAAYEDGAAIMVHHHPGHPVTGALSRTGTVLWPAVNTGNPATFPGTSWDTTAGGVDAILTGGAQEAQFLAYMDRLAAWISGLTDSRGRKIPVIVRWFHEYNALSFWWGSDTPTKYIQLWQKFATYMRVTKGVTNALYCPSILVGGINPSSFYPGDSHCDMWGVDIYNTTATPSFDVGTATATTYAGMAATTTKPLLVAEFGYDQWKAAAVSPFAPMAQTLSERYPRFAAACVWRAPWGPDSADSAPDKAKFKALTDDQRVILSN